jgi:DNA excision repair protein ERCC-4
VHTSLGQRKADVIELFQPLTRPMEEIQTAIIECMETTLTELRKSCTGVSG